ncbi:MAG: type II toxin-antitoxin system RelE/ParE family toxin [Thermoproteota archaeon]
MPEYRVIAHRRVYKFLKELRDDDLKNRLKEVLLKLRDYPIILKRIDVEKLEGLEGGYRVRLGEYRIIFIVDKKEKMIFVTHIGKRESIYEKG